ncbi:unnamed protein product [Rangifer tarandus platyrhynchus]|uniref:Uncharacterized protein n=1 Tax=Rangifer tarandus platyrhynchus TaxID=3082113 RepID=A0AC59Y0V8_RANTA
MVSLRTIMMPVNVSLSLLTCYNDCMLRLKVCWELTHPPSWTYLVLIGLCHVLKLCYSFNCALPPSLLFQKGELGRAWRPKPSLCPIVSVWHSKHLFFYLYVKYLFPP